MSTNDTNDEWERALPLDLRNILLKIKRFAVKKQFNRPTRISGVGQETGKILYIRNAN